ncbi:MAG TPA: hypothetical protein VFM54_05750 [Micromonosporaceae bacterium]|nr:hypothetical protein [Micromonosporaceae bacterium]
MGGTRMRYLLVAGGALVVGMFVAGTSVQSLLPVLLVLACPLMMIGMMVGMRGHSGGGGGHSHHCGGHGHDRTATREDATTGR